MVNSDPAIRPFRIEVPEADLADLRDRLARTRWPDRECVDDWRLYWESFGQHTPGKVEVPTGWRRS